jgi:hypothetical protein
MHHFMRVSSMISPSYAASHTSNSGSNDRWNMHDVHDTPLAIGLNNLPTYYELHHGTQLPFLHLQRCSKFSQDLANGVPKEAHGYYELTDFESILISRKDLP